MEHHQAYRSLDLVIQEIDALIAAAPGSFARSAMRTPVDASSIPHKLLLTSVGDLKIALPMEHIGEIGTLPVITPLPSLPSWIFGIVNLRGEIVSVINIADFLGVDAAYTSIGSRFVLLRSGKVGTMVLIDRMHGTVDKTVAELKLPVSLNFVKRGTEVYVRPGFMAEDQPVHVLDVEAILSSRRFLDCRQ
jgi:chemotaxis signal transduction protein